MNPDRDGPAPQGAFPAGPDNGPDSGPEAGPGQRIQFPGKYPAQAPGDAEENNSAGNRSGMKEWRETEIGFFGNETCAILSAFLLRFHYIPLPPNRRNYRLRLRKERVGELNKFLSSPVSKNIKKRR